MAEATVTSPRRRGVKRLAIVAILLVLLLVGLAVLRPDLGSYPAWAYPIIHLLWLLAAWLFGTGSFHAIVGAPDDPWFRAMRTAIGVLVGISTSLTFVIGAWLLQTAMAYERTEADHVERSSSWDDD